MDWLNKYFFFIGPKEGRSDEAMKVEEILEQVKELVLRNGVKAVIIDPWNEIDHTRPEHTTETDYTSHTLTRVRNFARAHELHVFLVAHPTKLQRLGNKQYPVPTPYDVSGSANWYNKADNAISVWRNLDPKHKEDPVQFHIQKVRNKKNGRRGIAHLDYDFITGNYKDSNKYDFEEAPF
jgi:twinkle protein